MQKDETHFCSFRDAVTKDLNFDVPEGRMKSDRHESLD